MEIQKQKKTFSQWITTSITIRMFMVGILILILLIPLTFIQSLINERSHRQSEVIDEINQKWGNEVYLYGPILKIPYRKRAETSIWDQSEKSYIKEHTTTIENAYFFPETLNIDADISCEPLRRSIYESVVYNADMNISGSFSKPNFNSKDILDEDILWDKATILIKTTNVKGIKSSLNFVLNDTSYPLFSKYTEDTSYAALETKFLALKDLPDTNTISFTLPFNVNGSKEIKFIPIGKETDVHLASDWGDPSFDGNFLPNPKTKKVTKDGFKADWKVLHVNREFEQEFFGKLPQINAAAFGVTLLIPVDEYQKSERAAKYGYLVIALTFLAFFLIQTMSKIHIHPFQYFMIGLALAMFYTLLISISEHSSFFKAYIIASIAVITLITVYSKSILKSYKFTLLICATLLALYTFIFVLIQLKHYALLVGSIGLFLILAVVMMVSKNIDWKNA
ncbi:cell envelope integrity protein CreD [Aquimarina rhabdastrellae]